MAPHSFKLRWKEPGQRPRSLSPTHTLSPADPNWVDPKASDPKAFDPKPLDSMASNSGILDPDGFIKLDPLISSLSSQQSYSDPDLDPVLPCIQMRPTRQHQLPGIPFYSRLGCYQVIMGPRDILVPAPPRQIHSRRSARQSNTVKA